MFVSVGCYCYLFTNVGWLSCVWLAAWLLMMQLATSTWLLDIAGSRLLAVGGCLSLRCCIGLLAVSSLMDTDACFIWLVCIL